MTSTAALKACKKSAIVAAAALSLGLGETIDLIPEMADPKDLYSKLRTPTVAARAIRILYEPQPA